MSYKPDRIIVQLGGYEYLLVLVIAAALASTSLCVAAVALQIGNLAEALAG